MPALHLYWDNLEQIALKEASLHTGVVNDIGLTVLDHVIHFLFYYVFYIFYPAYEQFYYEKMVELTIAGCNPIPAVESSTMREAALFIHRFVSSPSTIGSIFPSSTALIESITRKIPDPSEEAHRYLEIGAGTGSFTEEITKKLGPNDHLDIVEYDADLCRLLQKKYGHLQNVTIHHISILDFQAEQKYDVVVSGLPLNAFTSEFVEVVLQKYVEVTKPGGNLSYFEYIALGELKKAFLFGEAEEDFQKVLSAKDSFVETYGQEVDEIYRNMTPARVQHCIVV